MEVKCNWCKKVKSDNSFIIGASSEPDWVLVYGTGKMTCPDCHAIALKDADKAFNKFMNKKEG